MFSKVLGKLPEIFLAFSIGCLVVAWGGRALGLDEVEAPEALECEVVLLDGIETTAKRPVAVALCGDRRLAVSVPGVIRDGQFFPADFPIEVRR